LNNAGSSLPSALTRIKKHLREPGDDWDLLVNRSWEGFIRRYDSQPVMRERFDANWRHPSKEFHFLLPHYYESFNSPGKGLTRGGAAGQQHDATAGITNVDRSMDLYFERFYPERTFRRLLT